MAGSAGRTSALPPPWQSSIHLCTTSTRGSRAHLPWRTTGVAWTASAMLPRHFQAPSPSLPLLTRLAGGDCRAVVVLPVLGYSEGLRKASRKILVTCNVGRGDCLCCTTTRSSTACMEMWNGKRLPVKLSEKRKKEFPEYLRRVYNEKKYRSLLVLLYLWWRSEVLQRRERTELAEEQQGALGVRPRSTNIATLRSKATLRIPCEVDEISNNGRRTSDKRAQTSQSCYNACCCWCWCWCWR